MRLEPIVVSGQPSYQISTDMVDLSITVQGGHMAPVSFYKNSDPVQPYYISHWSDKGYKDEVKVLEPLRGDFFCLPFGGNNVWKGENHQPHGETACNLWKVKNYSKKSDTVLLTLNMITKERSGEVEKNIYLKESQNVVYSQHLITGFEGKAPLGHHVTLPGTEHPFYIDTSPIHFGMTDPDATQKYANEEYYSLQPGQRFSGLKEVPTIWKDPEVTDCSLFPAREGFMDIIQIFNKTLETPGWTAVTHPQRGYLWFSLKNIQVLPSTVIWMENYGRKGAPWNSRNCCIGLEDVCSFMATGLAQSVEENEITAEGIPTCHTLSSSNPFKVNYIQGVCKIPNDFDRVETIDFSKSDFISINSFSGKVVKVPVNHPFIFKGDEVL